MALWKCTDCDFKKDSRCKPRKCPECEGTEFVKDEEGKEPKRKWCCSCSH